jgi:hypothetical protein
MDGPIRLAIIVGSTRPGRMGPAVAGWFAGRARRLPAVICALGMLPVGPDVTVHRARGMLDEGSILSAPSDLDDVADLLLTELESLAATLRLRRQPDAVPSVGA